MPSIKPFGLTGNESGECVTIFSILKKSLTEGIRRKPTCRREMKFDDAQYTSIACGVTN
jgi:hypothetical protein